MAQEKLAWQSKLVLLAVLPFAGTDVLLACFGWATESVAVVVWVIGLSALLGLITWKLRAATPAAAAAGALITASLMFSTGEFPYEPWHTALIPTLAVSTLAFAATRIGRSRKERLGTAEARRGRSASQVVANLGMAALVASDPVNVWLLDSRWLPRPAHAGALLLAMPLAALAEAAADTVSSEIGQVLGGRPRMITTLRAVEPGTDGAVSAAGTLAGLAAAAIVAGAGTWAMRGDWTLFKLSCAGAVFGLFFDSLLGATFERVGWLNNDAVNFLSTASASGIALAMIALLPHSWIL
ncbi:MAG: DUF92 domain-containing protein [Terracidiphilus sp.]